MTRRRVVACLLVAVALAAAALLAVLARGAFAVDDELAAPVSAVAEAPDRTLGQRVARALSGTTDDLRLRDALRLVLAAEEPGLPRPRILELHGRAIALLLPIVQDVDDPRRGRVANVVGLLYLADSELDETITARAVQQAGEAFAEAVEADPGNADAKFNLELVLSVEEIREGTPGEGDRSGGGATGAGERPTGSGY